MSEKKDYIVPDDPYETQVTDFHTKLLYYASNEIIQQKVASKYIGKRDDHVFMSARVPNTDAAQLDDLFVELLHSSPTTKLEHTLTLEACTRGWFSRGRFAKHVLDETESGYPTVRLTLERGRHLASPLSRAFGSFVLRSEISYECTSRDDLLTRQSAVSISGYDLASCKKYAETHDELLWEEVYPYWENNQFNRQALTSGRYDDMRIMDEWTNEPEVATIQEFSTLMGALARISE